MGAWTLGKHIKARHKKVEVMYVCQHCDWSSANCHAVACHVPKCKGGAQRPAGAVKCEYCSMTFGTKRGCSQHLRHAHPTVWNEIRLAEHKKVDMKKKKGGARTTKAAKVQSDLVYERPQTPKRLKLYKQSSKLLAMQRVRWRSRVCRKALNLDPLYGATPRLLSESEAEGVGVMAEKERLKQRFADAMEDMAKRNESVGASTMLQLVKLGEKALRVVEKDLLSLIQEHSDKKMKVKDQHPRVGLTQIAMGSKARRKRERMAYKSTQELYRSNMGTLAKMVLDGKENVMCNIDEAAIYEAFKERWEMRSTFVELEPFHSEGGCENMYLWGPILPTEVLDNLKCTSEGSAPGPDGITKRTLMGWDASGIQLAKDFTQWLLEGSIPLCMKKCRTTLLPKSTIPSDLLEISNWRPITISSIIMRLFSRILTMRMTKACPMNPRQRGFMSDVDGCAENLMILDRMIRKVRDDKNSLAVVFIDFAKAFDSVAHEHIICALKQRGMDGHMVELIKDSYVGCTTRVKCRSTETKEIEMKVGVKQGDPMSPLLFNLALDPLIHTLEVAGFGVTWNEECIATLAFADDLVLLSGSPEHMEEQLKLLEQFCASTGLAVQPKKCHGFIIEGGAVNTGRDLRINDTLIHMVGSGQAIKYLGMQVGPDKGVVSPELLPTVKEWLINIGRASLKPSQKMKILNTYMLPRITYQATLGKVAVTRLTVVDRTVRSCVKEWLHLAQSTNNGMIYSRIRDGGLGVMRLGRAIPGIRAKCIWKMCSSEDNWSRSVAREATRQPAWLALWKAAGGLPEDTPVWRDQSPDVPQVETVLKLPDWKSGENLAWECLPAQGKGVAMFRNDKISNSWIRDPEERGFKQKYYLRGLAMRSGMTLTQTRSVMEDGTKRKKCSRCDAETSSMAHVLGQCGFVKNNIIRRHNKLCGDLQREMEKYGWQVKREFRVEVKEGHLLIPDIVALKEGHGIMLDITVRYENSDFPLEMAAAEKVAKYQPISGLVKHMLEAKDMTVYGFPLGARGKWPTCNDKILRAIGVPEKRRKSFASYMSRRALLYSIDVLNCFLKDQ